LPELEFPPMLDRMTPMKTLVQTATTEEFFQRGRVVARAADRGARMICRRVISFEEPAEMAALLTPKRLALFSAVSALPGPIADVAARLQRSPRTVMQDVNLFTQLGIFIIESTPDAPRGGRRVVRATTDELDLRCVVRR
jgi:predicted transcriptional regulator